MIRVPASLYILRVVVGGLCPASHGSESQRACSSWRNVFVWPWRSRSVPSFWWLLIHARRINEVLASLAFGSLLYWLAWRKWWEAKNKQLNTWLTEFATFCSINIETLFSVSMQLVLRVKSGRAARYDGRLMRRPRCSVAAWAGGLPKGESNGEGARLYISKSLP